MAYEALRSSEAVAPLGTDEASPRCASAFDDVASEALALSGGATLPCGSARRRCTVAARPLPLRRLCVVAAVAVIACIALGGTLAQDRASLAHLAPSHLKGVMSKFGVLQMSIDAYKKVFGGADPFTFECPLPGLGVLANSSAGEPPFCCAAYDALGWPYQFPECLETEKCASCWKASDDANLADHPVASLAGVAWASSLSVYDKAKKKGGFFTSKFKTKLSSLLGGGGVGDSEIKGKRLTASIGSGMSDFDTNLCPRISDWDEVMLNDDSDNIHARVLKSATAKLAVVVFRGTQMTSMKNWQVDADLIRTKLELGDGFGATEVHEGFLNSLKRVLPRVKKWLNGYFGGLYSGIPDDWTVLFTGHSLGGALATLAATLAELEQWDQRPNAVVVFGAPRIADGTLSAWWEARGLCKRLLRINTYNDVIHQMPLKTSWKWWEVAADFMKCAADISACMKKGPTALMGGSASMSFSDRWAHLCGNESETIVQSAVKGVNTHLEDFSAIGGAMAHFIDNCLYGYSFGVLRSGIAAADAFCGISRAVCERAGSPGSEQ
mmetsp:Transcript_67803/g.175627  ORF Transcript_67803/g.175627 Transcript_67803/m.175627 type:complete len:553 (+) Transcript_67803:77-1735(+)